MKWFFLKVYLRDSSLTFPERMKKLLGRFGRDAVWTQDSRGSTYIWSLGDFSASPNAPDGIPDFIAGRLFRTPKIARGRKRGAKFSSLADVDVEGLYDASEFIYDSRRCVLAQRKTAPFLPNGTIVKAYRMILGNAVEEIGTERDVHVALMLDEKYSDAALNTTEDLKEVKFNIVRPNPPGDDDLVELELGAILDKTNGDSINFDEKKVGPGSLAKVGFIPRTINRLLPQGYFKSGFLRFTETVIDLLKSKPKEKIAGTFTQLRDQGGTLLLYATEWIEALRRNEDVYRPGNEIEAPEGPDGSKVDDNTQ